MPELKLENSLVDNRYEVVERLGRGSFAEIFVARDRETGGMEVVLKALNTSLQGTPDTEMEQTLIENFRNEAVALDAVRHPRVILRLGHGTATDLRGTPFHYLSLEYMPGGDLLNLCRARPGNALPLDEALFYFKQACEALAYAHDKRIIHRDLKPNNFLLSADRRTLKIADFGVAKIATGEDNEITRVGSDIYAPPEHHPGEISGGVGARLTASADIYSLAKSFYSIVCGHPPIQFRCGPIICLPADSMNESVRRHLLGVLRRATDDDPAARYASVVEFWSDLAQVASVGEDEKTDEALDDADDTTIIRLRLNVVPGAMPSGPERPDFNPALASELRSEIADATRKGIDYARDTEREIGERAGEYYQTGVERASELTAKGKEAVSDLTDRGKDIISRQKGQFAAAIEAGKQGYREARKADQGKTSDEHTIGMGSGSAQAPSTLPASVKAEKSTATFPLLAASLVALLLLQIPNFVEQYTVTLDARISRIHALLARLEDSKQSYEEGERKKQEDQTNRRIKQQEDQANRIIKETMELIYGYRNRYADYDSEMTVLSQVSDTVATMTTTSRFSDYMAAFEKAANMISDADLGLKPLKSALLTSSKSLHDTFKMRGIDMTIERIEWKLSDSDYYTLVSLTLDAESRYPSYYYQIGLRNSSALSDARQFAAYYVEHKTALAREGPLGRVVVFLGANLSSVTNETLRTYRPKLLPNRLDDLLWALVGFLLVWGLAKMRATVQGGEAEQRAHNDARRFARLLVSEIRLYNAAKVNDGRRNYDLYDRLKDEIDRNRKVYDKRVSPTVVASFDYFYDELVQTLAEGDPAKLGKDCPGPVALA